MSEALKNNSGQIIFACIIIEMYNLFIVFSVHRCHPIDCII